MISSNKKEETNKINGQRNSNEDTKLIVKEINGILKLE